MTKYLYGANVKAVQQFIFQTNKLKEIIGASELVEQICTTLFSKQTGKKELDKDPCCIISAAGIIKYIFEDEAECRNLVRVFPKVVYNATPGIIFNQAVVEIGGDKPTPHELKELEQRLKTQHNKAIPPLETGLRITERSRRTGLPAIEFENKEGVENVTNDPKKKEAVDKATSLKKKAGTDWKGSLGDKLSDKNCKDLNFLFPSDIKEIASESNYIAIIHADGNNLGKAFRDLNEKHDKPDAGQKDSTKENKDFSQAIEEATLAAARTAVKETFKKKIEDTIAENGIKNVLLPMRPVILGGDDFTVICKADYALELTATFLAEFEKKAVLAFKSRGLILMNQLTACAGIAYIKTNYPFHYGAKLAEDLCGYSKKIAKEINSKHVPACLTFHRVQSSFVGEYEDLIGSELTAPASGLSFCGGPYFISLKPSTKKEPKEYQYLSVDELLTQIDFLRKEETPTSKLRDWISTCHIHKSLATEDLERIIKVLNDRKKSDIVEGLDLVGLLEKINDSKVDPIKKTALYDAITIHSLTSKNS